MKKLILLMVITYLWATNSEALPVFPEWGDAPGYDYAVCWNPLISPNIWLGQGVDFEASQNSIDSFDDGIIFSSLIIGGQGSFTFTLSSQAGGDDAYLSAWADWDQNGIFDFSERIGNYLTPVISAGINSYSGISSFSIPNNAVIGDTWFRATILFDPAESADPTGDFGYGEVEDYRIQTQSSPSAIPEPSTILLLLSGVIGFFRRRKY